MAQLYRVIPVKLDGNTFTLATCDPQNLAIQDELRTFLGYDIKLLVATEREIATALERYYGSSSETFESLVSDLEDDNELERAAESLLSGGADRYQRRRGVGRECPGAQAAEHGVAAGDQRPRQRHSPGTVRRRIPDPHQGRRRAVRNGAAATPHGVRHYDAHQGHGEPGHCRASAASGRSHRIDRCTAIRSTCASASCPRCLAKASSCESWTAPSSRWT